MSGERAERLLTVAQAAELLATTERFPRRLIAERRIRFVRLGRHVRIPESADAIRVVLLTICRPDPGFLAPTGAAGLICLAWARGRGSQVRAASGCVPSLNHRKG